MKSTLVLGATLWIALSFWGMVAFAKYKSAPGPQGRPVTDWPASSSMRRDSKKPTLALFIHPRCPCTRATVEELIAILTQTRGRADIHVAFYAPAGTEASWSDTDITRSVAGLPGVTMHRDEDGREARSLGAETSGHAVLFDVEGRRRFSGGITGLRGHPGNNPGRQAVVDLIMSGASRIESAPVFGCPLFPESSEAKP